MDCTVQKERNFGSHSYELVLFANGEYFGDVVDYMPGSIPLKQSKNSPYSKDNHCKKGVPNVI